MTTHHTIFGFASTTQMRNGRWHTTRHTNLADAKEFNSAAETYAVFGKADSPRTPSTNSPE